jgi:hypothetical protein
VVVPSATRADRSDPIGPWRSFIGPSAAILGGAVLLAILAGLLPLDATPRDAHAYWAVDLAEPYRLNALGSPDAYLYSPAFAQLLEPLRALPFDVFRLVWVGIGVGAMALIGALPMLLFPGALEDLVRGNIHVLMAAAIVVAFRHPAAWAFVLLTKVTPGIGLVWYAVRREWRALGIVALATAAVVVASLVVGGLGVWAAWVESLTANTDSASTWMYFGLEPPPLWSRLLLAALLVTWGARTDRRWTVPVGAMLALPVIWPSGAALLVAAVVVMDHRAFTSWPAPARHAAPRRFGQSDAAP